MSSLSQTQKDRLRKQKINSSQFDWNYINNGGPINHVLSCGFINKNYTKGMELKNGKTGYDQIKWDD